MRAFAASTLPALFAMGLAAQTVQTTASGTLRVDYQPQVGGVVQHSLPGAGSTTLNVSGVATSALVVGPTATTLDVTAISPPWNCYGCWSMAAGDVRIELSATSPVAGILRLDLVPACQMSPVYIDVDDDGSWEIWSTATVQVDIPVVLGSEPLPVRLCTETVNFGGASCSIPAAVTFLPQPTNLSTVGSSCGPSVGGSLTGSGSARGMTLRIGSSSGQLGALGIGGLPTTPVSCGPVAVPVAAMFLPPDPNGIEVRIPISPVLLGTFVLQYVELDPAGQLRFSNGFVAALP